MASEIPPNDSWDLVASQLRAYRQAQEQAWGEIDNATLGRFIADDLSGAERQQIEQALDERPELRKLTDLVRDVLADFEPAVERVPVPAVPVPTPRLLPFPNKHPNRPSVGAWVRKRSGMFAAACLLLVLSGSLLDPRVNSALLGDNSDHSNTDTGDENPAVALRTTGHEVFYGRTLKPGDPAGQPDGTPLAFAPGAASLNRLEILNQKIDGLEQEGKLQEALALDETAATVARRANLEQHLAYAANRERVAAVSQKQGDLERASDNLCQAYAIRKKELGPKTKETAQTARSLANVYALAINAGSPDPYPQLMMKTHPDLSAGPLGPPDSRRDRERKAVAELHDRLLRESPTVLKQQVVPVILQGLQNAATEKEREQFVRAVGNLGPQAAVAAPVLTARLQKAQAMESLKKGVMPFVAMAKDAPDEQLTVRERCAMLWALGRMGPEVRDAVPVLVEALNSDVPEVRRTADNALVNMGPAVRESLVQLVRNEPKEKDDAKAVAVENVLKRLDEQSLAAKRQAQRALLGIIVGPAPLPANVGKCPLCP